MSTQVGQVVAIHRYPVKSMQGEALNAVAVTGRGLLGDRAMALIDVESGKVISAKNPRRWPNLFDFRAGFITPPRGDADVPPVRITLPNGDIVESSEPDAESRLTAALGRPVRFASAAPSAATAEGVWPEVDSRRGQVFEFPLPPGTFFDERPQIHLLTTATLNRLRVLAPTSRFEIPRFRPNLVIDTGESEGFPENGWHGQVLSIGSVRLRIDGLCPRCIMTTLTQDSLPKDPAVLKTIADHNHGDAGVYATVLQGGAVQRGAAVQLEGT